MRKEKLQEEQLLEEKKLSNSIESGREALVKYQEAYNLIEETSYQQAKNFEVLDDENVQSSFMEMQREREETTLEMNKLLERMNEDFEEMKKRHKNELEDFED